MKRWPGRVLAALGIAIAVTVIGFVIQSCRGAPRSECEPSIVSPHAMGAGAFSMS
jgi:hypothetical protein